MITGQTISDEIMQEAMAVAQHVAYFDDGEFHWMSGIAPRNCELYTSPPPVEPTPPVITDEMVERAARVMAEHAGGVYGPEDWGIWAAQARHTLQAALIPNGGSGDE